MAVTNFTNKASQPASGFVNKNNSRPYRSHITYRAHVFYRGGMNIAFDSAFTNKAAVAANFTNKGA